MSDDENQITENAEEESTGKAEKEGVRLGDAFEWLESIAVAVVAVIFLFTFIFRIVGIKGPSMQNTLFEKDRVIISNLFYTPKCGDIVVISRNYLSEYEDSSDPIIKRVIATEGMVVDIDFEAGIVYVDGVALDEPYTRVPTTTQYDVEFPLRVGENQIFVLGDNRGNSMDSRDSRVGLVDRRYVLGKALFRIYRSSDYREKFSDMFGVLL